MRQPSSPASLDAHLGYWLRMVSNQVSLAFARQVQRCGVTVAEWVLLRELFDVEATSPGKLATNLGLTRGAVSKLAERLVAKGFIDRAASQEDGRAQVLSLTKAGRALVPDLARIADLNDERFFAGLSAAERATLRRLLEKLVRHHGLTAPPLA